MKTIEQLKVFFASDLRNDLYELEKAFSHSGAFLLLTTEKDLIKIPAEFIEKTHLTALIIEVRMTSGEETFLSLID